jgi:hypothetical protein
MAAEIDSSATEMKLMWAVAQQSNREWISRLVDLKRTLLP